MASVVFAREPVTHALLTEALPLLTKHWGEVAHYPDIPLTVDVEGYVAAADSIRCYTVRGSAPSLLDPAYLGALQDGVGMPAEMRGPLAGYALFFVRANLHYSQSTQAVQDVVYLHPSVRGGTGARFLAYCDEQLASEGVQVVYHHAKFAHPQLGKALIGLGYEPVETIYGKRLDVPTLTAAHVIALAAKINAQTPEQRQLAYERAMGAVIRASDLTDFTELMHASADVWAGEDGG